MREDDQRDRAGDRREKRAFGLTGGGVFISQPLAVVVIGGLTTSTLMTVVLVPVLYTTVERRKLKHRRRVMPSRAG